MRRLTYLHYGIALKPTVNLLRRDRGSIRISHRKRKSVGIIDQITLSIPRPFFLHGVHFSATWPPRSINSSRGSSAVVLWSKSKAAGRVSGSNRQEIEQPGKWRARRGVSGSGTAAAEGGGERDWFLTSSGGIGGEEEGSRVYGEHYPKYWTQSDSSACFNQRIRRWMGEIVDCRRRRVHTQWKSRWWWRIGGWAVQS